MTERKRLTEADRRNVGQVFLEHQAFVESIARQHAPSPDLVPDIVQSVGLKICRSLNGFREESQLRTWLYRVTVNAARDVYRDEVRHQRAADALGLNPEPEDIVDADGMIIRNRRMDRIREATGRLKPQHQVVIGDVLADHTVLHVDSKSRSRRYRAIQALRSAVRDDQDPGGE